MPHFKPNLQSLESRLVPATILFPQGIPYIYSPPGSGNPEPPADSSSVCVFIRDDANQIIDRDFVPYPGFRGDITVSQGDITGDGIPEIITGCGYGGTSGHITLWDGARLLDLLMTNPQGFTQPYASGGALLGSFYAFPGYNLGISVRLGDMNGDNRDDVIFAPGIEAGPYTPSHVRIWDGPATISYFSKTVSGNYDYSFELASFYCLGNGGLGATGGVSLAVERLDGPDRLAVGQFFADTVGLYALEASGNKFKPVTLGMGPGERAGNSVAIWRDQASGEDTIATSMLFPEFSREQNRSTNRFLPHIGTLDDFPFYASGSLWATSAPPLIGYPSNGTLVNRLAMANMDQDPAEELLVAYRDSQQVDVYDRIVMESAGIRNETLEFLFTLGNPQLLGGSWI